MQCKNGLQLGTDFWRFEPCETCDGDEYFECRRIARSCSCKVGYESETLAKHFADERGMNYYRCQHCGLWHLGTKYD